MIIGHILKLLIDPIHPLGVMELAEKITPRGTRRMIAARHHAFFTGVVLR
jgi:hypothetical protein